MNKLYVNYSWEDKVTALVDSIILKLYKEHNPDKVLEIKELVKKHLDQ